MILVRKASGEEEVFDIIKLERSLNNAGASNSSIIKIIANIEKWIYSGVTTKKIYSRAFALLRKERTTSSMLYKLKHAIIELGPTGYPFENFIGQLFSRKGFDIEVGVVVDGKCVTHEMDVIATKDNTQHLVECKHSKDQGKHVSIQVPLYVRARVDDIIKKRKEMPEYKGLSYRGWVITNTRFSSESIQYAKCSGLKLLAWDYPNGNGLKEMIESVKIYPITILHNLTKKQQHSLLDQSIATCLELLNNNEAIKSLGLSKKKEITLIKELNDICN